MAPIAHRYGGSTQELPVVVANKAFQSKSWHLGGPERFNFHDLGQVLPSLLNNPPLYKMKKRAGGYKKCAHHTKQCMRHFSADGRACKTIRRLHQMLLYVDALIGCTSGGSVANVLCVTGSSASM